MHQALTTDFSPLRALQPLGLLISVLFLAAAQAQDPEQTAAGKVKKVIFSNCQGCHTNGGHAGGLKMDSLESLVKGGDRGTAVTPGNPDGSLIVRAIQFNDASLKMPPRGRIPQADIDSVRRWIQEMDPRGTGSAPAAATSAADSEPPPKGRPMIEPPRKTLDTSAAPAKPVTVSAQGSITPEQEQFFETKIRPLLAANCYACHTQGANGGLRLDSREAVLNGGLSGTVLVPGNPQASLMVTAVHYRSKLKMPPSGPLKAEEVSLLEKWIQDGAPWPEVKVAQAGLPVEARDFWSFRAPARVKVPAVNDSWVTNDVDRFVLAKLKETGLTPVDDADKRILIRRVTYDLTGLPPTVDEISSFLSDHSADAYRNLVERLLASRAYGERWGRKWLDLVRYADTSGSGGDNPIPQAIKYRDYVILAIQKDKPYDRFIREQLAGDLLPYDSEEEHWENVIATGYLANAPRTEERNGHYADIVDNLGATFLGLSVACARCHDHKFDPVPTADYYSLYGIFTSTQFPSPGDGGPRRYQTGFTYRDPKAPERTDWKTFQKQLEPITNALSAVMRLPGTYDDLVPQLQVRRMNLFEHAPDLGESAYAVTEGTPADARIQIYGDAKNLGPVARRGFPQVLGGGPLGKDCSGSGRLDLARWLTSPENPLTARVIVNRIWQGHFGRGIVSTPNDFGLRGTAPSNQALLDFLAWKLIDSGWSTKAIHREILYSHTYRLSSRDHSANHAIDPENAFLWRHSRHRLEAEEIRDTLLAISGQLDLSPGGPHPFPPMAKWNYEEQNMFEADPAAYETNHRTVYAMVQRTARPELFVLFDGPSTNASTEARTSSLTPLQALYFMNGEFPKKAASAFADRVLQRGASTADSIVQSFQSVYGRPPAREELERTRAFLAATADKFASQGTDSKEARVRAFEQFTKALFASNEFMFVE